MTIHPITISIAQSSRGAKIYEDAENPEASLSAELRQKVFQRDDNTCQCCGFKSQKYQDGIFADGRKENLKFDNLLTACIYCHQCFDLEKVAQMRSGVLVWLPEISQPNLHHIARAIYVSVSYTHLTLPTIYSV